MQKPRPYNGPVRWLDEAQEFADAWAPPLLFSVQVCNPYLVANPNGVRVEDWVKLVAHVALRREEQPLATATRLALYVKAYRESYHRTLSLVAIRDAQEPPP